MEIKYRNKKIEKICSDYSYAVKKYNVDMANKIVQRVNELSAADTVEQMVQNHIGRCHALSENRKNQYALDLIHPYRLIFVRLGNIVEILQAVEIQEIVDYH